VRVAGEANFAPAWDRKAATIRTTSTRWRPGEGIILETQFLFEKPWYGCARLRSCPGSLLRRVGLPIFELVAAWSKAHPSPLVADFLKTLDSVSRLRRGTQAVQANLEFARLKPPLPGR
jgi:hypothetical protein